MKFFLFLLSTMFIFTSCMDLKDINAGLWYSARSVNEDYMDLLKTKCNLKNAADKHLKYLKGDSDLETHFKEKYGETIFANASVCSNSLNNLTCSKLKKLVATDIEKSTLACITTFSNRNLDACISFNYYFAETIKNNCENGDELSSKHILEWSNGQFYCSEKYNNSVTKEDSFPPREICMKKILNLDCKEIENEFVARNIESELDCYMDK